MTDPRFNVEFLNGKVWLAVGRWLAREVAAALLADYQAKHPARVYRLAPANFKGEGK